jgi:hypothetical protein
MRHDLMPEKIEIDPGRGTAPLWAPQHGAVKMPGRRQVIHRKREMEWRQAIAAQHRRRVRSIHATNSSKPAPDVTTGPEHVPPL